MNACWMKYYQIRQNKCYIIEAIALGESRIDLVTRAVFYCARMLSAQLDTEFTPQNYDDVKKVYSIWVCMNAPDYAAYTITKYKMTKENTYGCIGREHRYDLLEAVMICLGKEEKVKKGIEKGIILNLMELVAEGHLEMGIAAKKLNITVEEFAEKMEKWKG